MTAALSSTRPRAWAYILLWVVLPPLAIGYQFAAEETARALMGTPFGGVWFLKGAALISVRWILALEVASFVVWMIVLDRMKLSQAFPASAMSYVLVLALGWFVYHENATPMQLVGSCVILTGIWLINHETREDA